MIYLSEVNERVKMHSPTLTYAVKRIRLERDAKLNELLKKPVSDDDIEIAKLKIQESYRRKLDLIVDKHII
tara:strand:- start:599 stop:811 length:213 start_codon:yes stop_codon:yes gene_type:complete